MSKTFKRPNDFSYNADLKSLQSGIEHLMDVVEDLQDKVEALSAKKPVKRAATAKAAPKAKDKAK